MLRVENLKFISACECAKTQDTTQHMLNSTLVNNIVV